MGATAFVLLGASCILSFNALSPTPPCANNLVAYHVPGSLQLWHATAWQPVFDVVFDIMFLIS